MENPADQTIALPVGWHALTPGPSDVPDLHALRAAHETAARGTTGAGLADVETEVIGDGSAVRSHLLVRDAAGTARGWATVHDRAAGRVLVAALVDPALDGPEADGLAAALLAWAEGTAAEVARGRDLTATQLDSGAFEPDTRQQRWLAAAGYTHVRTWLQMTRPVQDEDRGPAAEPAAGAVVRPVRRAADGMPDEADLVAVHDVLEQAFADHFNHHEETFDEFCDRLRADPGHRWDHWWLGELVDGDVHRPAGALVAGASLDADGTPVGSYVEYLGVLRTARGRGLASALLDAVVTDAAERGRRTVGLEVDADSPTGAADLYRSLGFETKYVTQSWHREITLGTP
ncbi:N-acetyltransferase [Cellulomonas sp. SLBN-39]|uniref:GNAT family N-acetyltransferase n=1 Tax=Cellulomonas sp. SLBN-39 TaxID=2768446 RepID=UPI0011745281|nr:N-acetyltransferase [Cellulomonas sp. SLBN-39]TQL03129.1 ribosomal protein S18 acetylase RimI-like enzyme [Cellulomonas sp. SLBN-39]